MSIEEKLPGQTFAKEIWCYWSYLYLKTHKKVGDVKFCFVLNDKYHEYSRGSEIEC